MAATALRKSLVASLSAAVVAAAATMMCTAAQAGDNWLQFRQGTGASAEAPGPRNFSPDEGIAWKAELPGKGLSSPIVCDGHVYVTASSGVRQDRLHLLSFNDSDGKLDWDRQFVATGRTMTHSRTYNAAPSPCSDGNTIFAMFSSGDCIAVAQDGTLKWFRGLNLEYPNASNSLGMASSPLVTDGVLIVQLESDSQSVALGLDTETGKTIWSQDRPKRANWTSPVIIDAGPAGRLVLLQSSAGLSAVRPASGETVWSFTGGASTIPSSAVSGGNVYVPANGITALDAGNSASPPVLWNESQLSPATGSPLVVGDRIYVLNRAGVLLCADTANGKVAWKLRLKGSFAGSPVAAQGMIYAVNEEGLVQIVSTVGSEGEVIAEVPLTEDFQSTPALANGALYLRTLSHLWKVTGK